jgi:hypothetical protein
MPNNCALDSNETTWTVLKALSASKTLALQYVEDAQKYDIFVVEGKETYYTAIFKSGATMPLGIDSGQNSADRADFETNYKSGANAAVVTKVSSSQLPAALVGGRLDVVVGASLPSGTNRVGAVRLVDGNDARLDLDRNTAIPAGSRGLLALGQDEDGAAQALDVREDSVDLVRRLQVEGRVSVMAPSPPPSTTSVSVAADNPLSISSNITTTYVITNAKTFHLQQITAGSEGDSTERGSCVEVSYYDGTTNHLIERVYLNGFTTSVSFNNVSKSRDGTTMTGNGSTKTIRVLRRRLSGASQEVDAVVRGYES